MKKELLITKMTVTPSLDRDGNILSINGRIVFDFVSIGDLSGYLNDDFEIDKVKLFKAIYDGIYKSKLGL